LVIKADFF